MGKERVPALRRCMDLLAVRGYSRAELTARLTREEYLPAEVETAVAECVQRHYLDDAALAADYAESLRGRNYGAARIAQKLRQKGLETAMPETVADPEAELAAAQAALENKLRTLAGETDRRKKREKLFRHLAGRGFAPEVIFRALERADLSGEEY